MANNRIKKLQKNIEKSDIDGLLISQIDNIRYLCSFNGSSGWLFVNPDVVYLFVDSLHIEQAKSEITDEATKILLLTNSTLEQLFQIVIDSKINILGFESVYLSFSVYQQLNNRLKNENIWLSPCKDYVEAIRIIKEPDEINNIKKAAVLCDGVFNHAVSIIKPGVTETHIAWEMEKYLRDHGSEAVPFDIIVASGPNAAMPHARPSDKTILNNEPVLLDFGSSVNGYCCDISRTLYTGKYDETFRKIYDIVLAAQLNAISGIVAGINGQKADSMAREIIEKADYGQYFGHGLGHGVGIMVHEKPVLNSISQDIIDNNMVFTVEPGVYLPGWGGIRIEDTVLMEEGKVKVLTQSGKTLNI